MLERALCKLEFERSSLVIDNSVLLKTDLALQQRKAALLFAAHILFFVRTTLRHLQFAFERFDLHSSQNSPDLGFSVLDS
jgi:hypothetical protein